MYKKLKILYFIGLLFAFSYCCSSDQDDDNDMESFLDISAGATQTTQPPVIPGMPSLDVSAVTADPIQNSVTSMPSLGKSMTSVIDIRQRCQQLRDEIKKVEKEIIRLNIELPFTQYPVLHTPQSITYSKNLLPIYQRKINFFWPGNSEAARQGRAAMAANLDVGARMAFGYRGDPDKIERLNRFLEQRAQLQEEHDYLKRAIKAEEEMVQRSRLTQSIAGQGAAGGGSPYEESLPPLTLSTARPSQALRNERVLSEIDPTATQEEVVSAIQEAPVVSETQEEPATVMQEMPDISETRLLVQSDTRDPQDDVISQEEDQIDEDSNQGSTIVSGRSNQFSNNFIESTYE